MLENQFIRITGLYPYWGSNVTPVMFSSSLITNVGYQIFVEGDVTSIAVLKKDGTEYAKTFVAAETAYALRNIGPLLYGAGLAEGDRFMLKSYKGETAYRWSNVLVCCQASSLDSTYISYRCNEDAFGFPFSSTSGSLVISLPFRLHSPQNVQDDKTYVKANGEVVTLYAKYYKEWEGETEYLSEDMHDKIVAALSCDEVYINGRRMTKSDKYQVDWDKYDLDCDGVTKLAKATFKVREHITQRNSNY